MVGKRLISLIFVLVALGAVPVQAQTPPTGESRSILGRIDQFGQNLFGGIFGEDRGGDAEAKTAEESSQGDARWSHEAQGRVAVPRQQQSSPAAGTQAVQTQRAAPTPADQSMTPRAGSILTVPPRQSSGVPQGSVSLGVSEPRNSSYGASRGTGVSAPAAVGQTPSRSEAVYRQPAPSAQSARPNQSGQPTQPSYSASQGYSSRQGTSGLINPAQRPLHQRLSTMRDSAFGAASAEDVAERQAPTPPPSAAPQPRAAADPPTSRQGEQLVIAQPATMGHGVPTPAVRPSGGDPTPAMPRAT
ncbi:MAG: hypothetical protein U1E05_27520, partial [Patescibacteria group bacterium]|nr:hypothetical protein [Patescibacteria group bacterium]